MVFFPIKKNHLFFFICFFRCTPKCQIVKGSVEANPEKVCSLLEDAAPHFDLLNLSSAKSIAILNKGYLRLVLANVIR